MYHFFVDASQIGEETVTITGEDVRHIRSVLRMKPGEEIGVCTGTDDRDIRCRIEELTPECVTARIMWIEHSEAELPSKIVLFQGLPKSDKMEMIIQKAVELGADSIVPVMTRRSVVKLQGGKAENRVRRWNAVSESAAKQSKRMKIPVVEPVTAFADAVRMAGDLDIILAPYELAADMDATRKIFASIRPGQSVGVFIGPEGGFEPEEAEMLRGAGAEVITLGRRILRTETAPVTVLSALMLLLDGRV